MPEPVAAKGPTAMSAASAAVRYLVRIIRPPGITAARSSEVRGRTAPEGKLADERGVKPGPKVPHRGGGDLPASTGSARAPGCISLTCPEQVARVQVVAPAARPRS